MNARFHSVREVGCVFILGPVDGVWVFARIAAPPPPAKADTEVGQLMAMLQGEPQVSNDCLYPNGASVLSLINDFLTF